MKTPKPTWSSRALASKPPIIPAWDKIYGDPAEPATSIVFGEKGRAKRPCGLQIVRHLADYNPDHPQRQVLVVAYDDFNPFLDRFRERFSGAGAAWSGPWPSGNCGTTWTPFCRWASRNWSTASWNRNRRGIRPPWRRRCRSESRCSQARDMLLLAACYDQSTAENREQRWRRLRAQTAILHLAFALGLPLGWPLPRPCWACAAISASGHWLRHAWPYAGDRRRLAALGLAVAENLAGDADRRQHPRAQSQRSVLRRILLRCPPSKLPASPCRCTPRTDDRYELLGKLQTVLRTLGLPGIVVLVDRLDEPYLINGSPELMRALLWPMLDNKFLKHPGLGVKLLLAGGVDPFHRSGNPRFLRKGPARQAEPDSLAGLDRQALCDVTDARIKACAAAGGAPSMQKLFDRPSIRGGSRTPLRSACAAATVQVHVPPADRRIAPPIPSRSRSGRSRRRPSSRCWPCIFAIRTPPTGAPGRGDGKGAGLWACNSRG